MKQIFIQYFLFPLLLLVASVILAIWQGTDIGTFFDYFGKLVFYGLIFVMPFFVFGFAILTLENIDLFRDLNDEGKKKKERSLTNDPTILKIEGLFGIFTISVYYTKGISIYYTKRKWLKPIFFLSNTMLVIFLLYVITGIMTIPVLFLSAHLFK